MSEWKEYILDEVVSKFIDYRGKTPTKTTFGIPLITAKIVKEGRLLEPNEFIAESEYQGWMSRGFPEINDVVLTTEAPLGEVALIKNKNVALAQRIITIQTKKDICNSIFLKYYLQSNEGQGRLQAGASGSTVEGIKASVLKKIGIRLPILPEQIAIASILSSLDDKIDLLHRQNKTLEQLAETLFRQWFVEEAEESWEKKFGELPVDIIDGDRGINYPKSTDFFTTGYCLFLNAGNVTKDGVDLTDCSFITKEKDEKLRSGKLKRNDIVLTTRGSVGNIMFYHDLIEFENIRINSGMVIFRTKSPDLPSVFLYTLMKTKYFSDLIQEHISGSAQPQLPIRDIRNIKLIVPPISQIKDFTIIAENMYNKTKSNQTQIRTLTQLRDTLLPKLMSGEVKVSALGFED